MFAQSTSEWVYTGASLSRAAHDVPPETFPFLGSHFLQFPLVLFDLLDRDGTNVRLDIGARSVYANIKAPVKSSLNYTELVRTGDDHLSLCLISARVLTACELKGMIWKYICLGGIEKDLGNDSVTGIHSRRAFETSTTFK